MNNGHFQNALKTICGTAVGWILEVFGWAKEGLVLVVCGHLPPLSQRRLSDFCNATKCVVVAECAGERGDILDH